MMRWTRWIVVAVLVTAVLSCAGCGTDNKIDASTVSVPKEVVLASGRVTSINEVAVDRSLPKSTDWVTYIHINGQPAVRIYGRKKSLFQDLTNHAVTIYGVRNGDWVCNVTRVYNLEAGTVPVGINYEYLKRGVRSELPAPSRATPKKTPTRAAAAPPTPPKKN